MTQHYGSMALSIYMLSKFTTAIKNIVDCFISIVICLFGLVEWILSKGKKPICSSISRLVVNSYAKKGPIPGLYSAGESGYTGLNEINKKRHFSLDVPRPSKEIIAELPEIDEEFINRLFLREGKSPKKSRVSVLLPFFAQHLTDAIFQSKNIYETDAPHEITLNQIYGNTSDDLDCLRAKKDGKLKCEPPEKDKEGKGEFPPRLFENVKGEWRVKDEFKKLSYLSEKTNVNLLLNCYKGREHLVCAVGLKQGNLTLGNFALTTLLLREHNRLCDLVREELDRKGKLVNMREKDDETIFEIASMINIITYMRVVVEDYINTFAGSNIFQFDTTSFFYEKERWCRSSPIPYHFNILYRIHCMIPDDLGALPDDLVTTTIDGKPDDKSPYNVFINRNDLAMEIGLGKVFELASNQAASQVCLKNTHPKLIPVEESMAKKARKVLASYAKYREFEGLSNTEGFNLFDANVRDEIQELYNGDFSKVDYAIGIFAEKIKLRWPLTWLDALGIKKRNILGDTLMAAIAKHAFRHIYSNPLMRREFLNPDVLTDVGWKCIQTTHTAADLIKRNVPEMSSAEAASLDISMNAPEYR